MSLAAGDWFAFTIDPQGNSVDYTSLSFYSDQFSTGGTLDVSYTVGAAETFILQGFSMPGDNASVVMEEVDFDDFSSTEVVTWTFYLYGASADNYGSRFDDITLYGSSGVLVGLDEPTAGFYRINLK